MASGIYEQLLEAYSLLNNITGLLKFKKFMIRPEGQLSLKGFNSPQQLRTALLQDIDIFMNKLDELSFFFIDDQLGGLKKLSAKRVKDTIIIIQEKPKNRNFTPDHFNLYKEFRTVQKEVKHHFLSMLGDELASTKSFKYVWRGSQRQLVELFDMLIKQKWITMGDMSVEKQPIPIIEMFDIVKNETLQPINQKSFQKEWQKDGDERSPANYSRIFDCIKENPRKFQ